MVGGDESAASVGQRVEHVADEPVGGRELGRVERRRRGRTRARPRRRPGSRRTRTALAGDASAAQCSTSTDAVCQPMKSAPRRCARGEARWCGTRRLVTTGTGRPRNALVALHVNGIGRPPPSASCQREHVEHVVVDADPEPDDAVLGRRQPGRDRRERGRAWSTGTTVVIGPPVDRAELGQDARRCGSSASHPRPSSTSSTVARASATGVGQPRDRRTPSSVGTIDATHVRPRVVGSHGPSHRSCGRGYGGRARHASVGEHCRMPMGGPMKVSTRGDYAARALLSLALHGSEQPDVGEGDRRAHRAPPALPRADPARGEGRRARALEARRRRRLRARPSARARSRSPTSSPRSTARSPR